MSMYLHDICSGISYLWFGEDILVHVDRASEKKKYITPNKRALSIDLF